MPKFRYFVGNSNLWNSSIADGPDFVERDSLSHDVGRFFLVVYNTSQTVSSSYATFIVMAISFALAAVFGALYYGIATGFTGNFTKDVIILVYDISQSYSTQNFEIFDFKTLEYLFPLI